MVIPKGSTFEDMVSLKGDPNIGEKINTNIIAPIAEANGLKGVIDQTDFNDDDKLGTGKDMVDRLSKLVGIFQDSALDFAQNRAGDDDLLGDAYEYLMRNFATESGKSKGQFYTPSEVSRIMSKVIGVDKADRPNETVYDPTCGSGSLLLKVVDEANVNLTIYGQENDNATTALAKMNMVLHNQPAAVHDIMKGNTLSDPKFTESGKLKRFDYVVANPPFSFKSWTNGIEPEKDIYNRFDGFGIPPRKNGDYAFLLHIIKSLKSTGSGAVILPHGVLFRGNAEARIRENLIKRGYLKGIIGLPANMFYGTGIPACILIIDKSEAPSRKGIFMVNASNDYIKDGNKNRLRERDIHRIVDVFRGQKEEDRYSRFVSNEEIVANEYNLNIPRYIDTSIEEDIQDLQGHLKGGIPERDIDGLNSYWEVYSGLKEKLFAPTRDGYFELSIDKSDINETIFSDSKFCSYSKEIEIIFNTWKGENYLTLQSIDEDTRPKIFIEKISDSLLSLYKEKALINNYDIYQHLMDYWEEIMRDDVYMIIEDGWTAKLDPVLNSKGKIKKGEFEGELIPKKFVIDRYFKDDKTKIEELLSVQESSIQEKEELELEHAVDEGLLEEVISDSGNVTKGLLTKRIKEIKGDVDFADEYDVLKQYKKAYEKESDAKGELKVLEKELDKKVNELYPKLTTEQVKQLVIDDKWLPEIKSRIDGEVESISRALTKRIKELNDRYEVSAPEIEKELSKISLKVENHLKEMGLEWA